MTMIVGGGVRLDASTEKILSLMESFISSTFSWKSPSSSTPSSRGVITTTLSAMSVGGSSVLTFGGVCIAPSSSSLLLSSSTNHSYNHVQFYHIIIQSLLSLSSILQHCK